MRVLNDLTKAQAARILDELMSGESTTADDRGPTQRAHAYERALHEGTVADNARLLASAYARIDVSHAEEKFIPLLEDIVIGALAVLLVEDPRRLRAEVRRATMNEPLPPLLSLPDRRAVLAATQNSIFVETALVVAPVGGGVVHIERARRGLWRATVDATSLALRHEGASAAAQPNDVVRSLAVVDRVAIFEAALASDSTFLRELSRAPSATTVEGRGVVLDVTGDVRVSVAHEGEVLVAIRAVHT